MKKRYVRLDIISSPALLSVKPQDKICKYCEITLDWGDYDR